MIFITDKRPDLAIYSSSLRRTLRFEGGRLETEDPAEIAVLRRNRYVTDFTQVEQELTSPSPLDPEPPADQDAVPPAIEEHQGDDRPAAE